MNHCDYPSPNSQSEWLFVRINMHVIEQQRLPPHHMLTLTHVHPRKPPQSTRPRINIWSDRDNHRHDRHDARPRAQYDRHDARPRAQYNRHDARPRALDERHKAHGCDNKLSEQRFPKHVLQGARQVRMTSHAQTKNSCTLPLGNLALSHPCGVSACMTVFMYLCVRFSP